MSERKPYDGTQRKLVIAMDLGTTFSGASYSILDPGRVPEIKGATRFPSQEHVGGDAKIPTIMYYDQEGNIKAVGAEALKQNVVEDAEDDGWKRCSAFKLHLRPPSASSEEISRGIPPLPDGMDVVTVFADFYAYLFDFPDDDEGHSRVHFVTEGEASLHFCIHQGLESCIRDEEGVMIVDAGGGTVDISTYSSIQSPNVDSHAFEEIAAPACNFTSSIYVTARAKLFLREKLAESRFADEVDMIAECFDATTKLRFRDVEEASFIKFGTMKDRDPKLDIRSGQLKLAGSEVAGFFEPSIASMIKGFSSQSQITDSNYQSVFLVGGFTASDWLFSKLKEHLEPLDISFSRPDSHVNKAVADGALSFYLDHVVAARASKYDYGVPVYTEYNPLDAEHGSRTDATFFDAAGVLSIGGLFSCMLPKHAMHLVELQSITAEIECYRGTKEQPLWVDEEPEEYSVFCTITADTSEVAKSLKLQRRPDGKSYFTLAYDIILLFGRTELKAQFSWKENDEEKRGPARIIYDRIV
ncbi:uncharacterized protein ARMOST_17507 [Armillaria ostoyae]|uniref:Actin-like ATPase domain-containing protein n=1 Tax=Armillaria ostoyae TaxID=47428 RepID=A0A284RZ61_ARMOS|nr:uncharacterized protein ARMOST_17507 [Armillaria ostoyae]